MARFLIRGLIAIVLGLSASSPFFSAQVKAADPLPVVATFSILGDLVQNVGGDRVIVTTIIGPGVDAHTFDPTPAQVVSISEAAVVFENGLGFEPWLDDIFESLGASGERVVVSSGIDLLPASATDHHDDHTDDIDPNEADPHIWQSVANAIVMVENIRDGLIAADPDGSSTYESNATAYLQALQDLDVEIMAAISTIPEDQRKLVTAHDTFGYYADRYGLEIIGTALGSTTTEGADPSAMEIASLIDEIVATGVQAIFPETVQNPGLIEQIADEAGVNVGPPLFTDALGPDGSPGDTYVGMMTFNTDAIVSALVAP